MEPVSLRNGKLIECRIRSLYGNPCRVRYGSRTEEMKLKAGEIRKVFALDKTDT